LRSIDTYVVQPENAWERLRAKLNRARDLAALQALAAWREKRAQDSDQPRSRVLKDDALMSSPCSVRPGRAFDKLRAAAATPPRLPGIIHHESSPWQNDCPTPERYRGPS
jgi:ribonuclease D